MKNIFTKVKQGNNLNQKIEHLLIIIEFSLFVHAIDIIFPIKNEFNYYFPFYFLNPILYLEFAKVKNATLAYGDPDHINSTLKNVKETENILFYTANNFITKLPKTQKSFCYYENYLVYIMIALSSVIILGFIFLIFSFEKDAKKSQLKNKYNLYLNYFLIVFNYIFLKPLLHIFLIIYSNYLIPFLFFNKSGSELDFSKAFFLISIITTIGFSLFFIDYLWIAYSKKIGDQFSFGLYEKIKLLNKILISFLIQFMYFDSIHIDFIKILTLTVVLYQCYIYYKNFIEGLRNNKIDFIFTNFLISLILVRFIDYIGNILNRDLSYHSSSYFILLMLLNFSFFFILTIKLNDIISIKLEKELFQDVKKIPLNLTQIMSNYIENIFSISNVNVFMNNLDINQLLKILKKHKINCINANNFYCNFCKKFDFSKGNNDQKSILKTILTFLNEIDKNLLGTLEKDYLVLTKLILIYVIDDFKIHRLSYFLIKNLKTASLRFTLILNFIYEKLIIRNMCDDDSNFVLLNYVELNELFIKAIKLSIEFNEELRDKSKSIKKIITKNYDYGLLHKQIFVRLQSLRLNIKNIDKSNFYKFLWCYNLVYNVDFHYDIILDLPETIDFIDESIFKFSFFLLDYHYDTNSWTFKKTPFIYMKNFGFTNKDMLGKSFDTIFPPLIKEIEKNKLHDLFKNSNQSRFTINTYLISKQGAIKNTDLTFDILPALYENSFIISNIINYDLDKKDNVIMIRRDGIILNTSEIPQIYLGISNRLIISHKELVCMQTLFGMKDFREIKEMPKKITLEFHEYYKNYTNSYIYEPTIKDNIEELDIKEFYNFYQKAKRHMKRNKLYVSLDLIEKRYNFYFYKCNIVDDQIIDNKTSNKNKKTDEFHFLEYFNIENEKEKMNNTLMTDDLGNIIKLEDAYTLRSAKNNTTSNSSGGEYFTAINKNLKNQTDKKVVEIISQFIWFYNVIIALLGLVFLIYIKIISSNVLNVYEVVKDIRIINSNYIDCMTHLVQLIVLDNSVEFDSLEKKAKILDNNINMNFSIYLHEEFKRLSNKVFAGRTKTNTDLLTYIDIDFLNTKLDTNTTNISLDGNMNFMPFLDLYQQFSTLAYQLSNIDEYYTNIPFFDVSNKDSLLKAFRASTGKEKIILSLMYNYKFINEKFIFLDQVMSDHFDSIYDNFKYTVHVLFIIIILVHLISIILSFIELYIFKKKLLVIIKALLNLRKRELEYSDFKMKSAQNLVDLEDKPSIIIESLKYRKNKIKRILKNEYKLNNKNNINFKNKNTVKYSNNQVDNNSILPIKSDKEKNNNEKLESKKSDDISNENITRINYNSIDQKGEKSLLKNIDKRSAKSEMNLNKNKVFFNNHLFSIVKLLFYIIISYILYSIIIFLIIENGFGNINISSQYIKEIVILERLSVNYLVSLKLAIAFNDTITPIQTNEFIDNPKNLYMSFIKIDNIIANYGNMRVVKDYMSKLKDENLCAVVLTKDLLITNSTIIDNICAFCKTNMIFSSNDKILISFFVQNMRNLYISFVTSNKSESSIGKIYNSELSQLINFIFLFFIRPFIRTTKDDFGFTIYLNDLNKMVTNCFILFGIVSLIDIVNFLVMKKNIANRISGMFENLKKITISLAVT